jgi:hypothetical protein
LDCGVCTLRASAVSNTVFKPVGCAAAWQIINRQFEISGASGSKLEADAGQSLKPVHNDYIPKPYRRRELLAKIREHLPS